MIILFIFQKICSVPEAICIEVFLIAIVTLPSNKNSCYITIVINNYMCGIKTLLITLLYMLMTVVSL